MMTLGDLQLEALGWTPSFKRFKVFCFTFATWF